MLSNRESGATLVEYAMILGLVVAVFVVAALVIRQAGEERGNKSAGIAKETSVPCIKLTTKTPAGSESGAQTSDCIESPGCLIDPDPNNNPDCYCCMP
jgi:hypothetical protein